MGDSGQGRGGQPYSVLVFDCDPKRCASIVTEFEAHGAHVKPVTSTEVCERLSILELVEHDAVVLQAAGASIAAARGVVDQLMGPQGLPVVPVVLLVDASHTLPFSAAFDLHAQTLPVDPDALRRVLEHEMKLAPASSYGSRRRAGDIHQTGPRETLDAEPPSVVVLDLESPPRPAASPFRLQLRRWAPVLGAGAAAVVAAAALVGVTTASPSPARVESMPAVRAVAPVAAVPVGTPSTILPDTATECPAGMVLVSGAAFRMGTDDPNPVLSASRPAHEVVLSSFCIDRTEVTVEAYQACVESRACAPAHRDSWWPQGQEDAVAWERSRLVHGELCNEGREDRLHHPINCVTWAQAEHYCEWKGARLPTEAQWELAARGTDGRRYPWGDQAPSSEAINGCGTECRAWRIGVGLAPDGMIYDDDDGYPGTAPVGSFPAGNSADGVADLAGNVFEWTADSFAAYEGAEGFASKSSGDRRVIRGGAFNSFRPEFADPALRFGQDAEAHAHGIGFRCAAGPR